MCHSEENLSTISKTDWLEKNTVLNMLILGKYFQLSRLIHTIHLCNALCCVSVGLKWFTCSTGNENNSNNSIGLDQTEGSYRKKDIFDV